MWSVAMYQNRRLRGKVASGDLERLVAVLVALALVGVAVTPAIGAVGQSTAEAPADAASDTNEGQAFYYLSQKFGATGAVIGGPVYGYAQKYGWRAGIRLGAYIGSWGGPIGSAVGMAAGGL